MEEVWKEAKGYEACYEVSNLGRVRDKEGNILPQRVWGRYFVVDLKKPNRSMFVHRIVAFAFVDGYREGLEVNHIDENRFNNCAENLEWITHKQNCNHGTRIQRIKEKQNMAVLQYTLDGEFIAEYASMHIAAEAIKAEAGHICDCCLGNRKWAYGYFWRYKDDALYEQAKKRIAEIVERGKRTRAEKFANIALNVIQMTMDGMIVAVHKSSKFAAEAVGSFRPMIINCCNGKIPHVKGYKFVYERDYLKQKETKERNISPVQLSLW